MKQFRMWISLALVLCTLVPFTAPLPVQAEDWGIITGAGVNMRSAPSGSIMRTLAKNTNVQVLGMSGNWYQIQVDGTTGYVYKTYLKTTDTAPEATPVPTATAAPSQTPVIGRPTATLLRYGMKGEDVKLLQAKLKELGYFLYHTCTGNYASATREAVKAFQAANALKADGIAGPLTLGKLFPADAATPTPEASEATPTPEVSAEATPTPEATAAPTPTPAPTVNKTYDYILRKGMTSDKVNELQEALKQKGYFPAGTTCTRYYGSVTYNAVAAFQRANGLKADGIAGPLTLTALFGGASDATNTPEAADPTPTPTPTPVPEEGGASAGDVKYTFARKSFSVTLKLGSTGVDVKDMQYALYLKGFYKGDITGTFDSTTKTAVLAYQKAAGLKQDGLAGEETLCTLYTLLEPMPDAALDCFRFDKGEDIACEIVKWEDATKLVPRQAIATIVDVETGYSFQVKRTGGSKHADMETLEALDTNVMFKTYGGKWSWTRRAIWVLYDGHKYAASMNGMPHGYETIGGNDLTGQFCVHFIGSHTHGSNKVDPDHQAAIQAAYQASVLKVESELANQ